jgi:amino acid transporter
MTMTDAPTNASTTPRLRRVLGQGGAAALSIGVMAPTLAMSVVGPEPARIVGRAAPLAFALAGLLVFVVSAGFVRLSNHFASAGSVYAFVGGAIGPRAGAFTGWTMLGTYLVFPWVSVAGFTIFGADLARLGGFDVDWYPLALAGWLVLGVLGVGGLRPAVRALIAFELGAVLVILALMGVVVGAARHPLTAEVFVPAAQVPAGALVTAATAAFLAYCGFEAAGSLGEEARSPLRTVPRAMLWTVGLGLVFYTVCVAVQVWGFGSDPAGVAVFAGTSAPLSGLAGTYVGPWLAGVLDVAALVSAVGAGLGCVIVAVRMLFALGRDDVLPPLLARVSPRTGAPTTALTVEMAVGLLTITGFRLAGATPGQMFFVLATIGVLHLLVMYAITNVAAVRFTRSGGRRWTQLAPAVGVVVAAAVLVQNLLSAPIALLATITLWLTLGVAVGLRAGRRL